MLLFTSRRSTEPPVSALRPRGSALRAVAPLLPLFLALGMMFGAMEVTSVAHLGALGLGAASGPVLALQALGSCAAGLLYGALRPRGLTTCLVALAAAMTLPWAAAATGSLPLLAVALLCSRHGDGPDDGDGDVPRPRRHPGRPASTRA